MRTFTMMLVVGCLTACVTDTGPVPIGQGVYTTGNGGSWFDAGGAVQADRYQRALRFCFDQGKQLVRVDETESSMRERENAGAEIRFRCAGPGEPGWKEPAG